MRIHKAYIRLFMFSILCSVKPLISQSDSCKRWRFSDLYFHNGFVIMQNPQMSMSDFRQLAPASTILNNNFSDLSRSYYNSYSSTTAGINLMAGIQIKNKKGDFNLNRQLRVGLSYNGFYSSMQEMSYFSSKRFDTMASPVGTLYFDSIRHKSLTMDYTYNQLRLDVSYISATNSGSRWRLYSGIGFSAGFSLNNTVNIRYINEFYIDAYTATNNRDHSYYFYPISEKKQSFRKKTNYAISVYIPLGISFHISRKHVFWKRVHAFVELRPGINTLIIPELHTYTLGYMYNTTGLRVGL